MINSKKINIIAIIMIVLALVFTLCLIGFGDSEQAKAARQMQYINDIFGDELATISIEANQEDWDNMIANASAKEYIMANITINGTTISKVGIRTKGNASLREVSNTDQKSRYSLRVKFDKYVKNQTYYGLSELVMNNVISDSTYMKEYMSQDLMRFMGIEAPLTNYANISVNGSGFGFYILIEAYGDSYKKRVYEDTTGNFYNVKNSEMGGGNAGGEEPPDRKNEQSVASSSDFIDKPSNEINRENQMPSNSNQTLDASLPADQLNAMTPSGIANEQNEQGQMPPDMNASSSGMRGGFPSGGGGGMGGSSQGGTLQYTDDSIDSYAAIFENAEGSVSNSDKRKVITALKNLSEGTNLEEYFDVDEVLRYLAAHTFVVNLDSYSSNMAQNYQIYERNGQLSILPWDYHLSYGGFQSGAASDSINFPIDTPVSGVSMEDRPLINVLLSNSEYREKYHGYLQEIVDDYINNGVFEQTVRDLQTKISESVKNDPSALYTDEEFETGVDTLIQWNLLRAQSIQGQLDGTIPSTTEGQKADPSALIDASSIDMNALGVMQTGGGGNGGPPDRANENQNASASSATMSNVASESDMHRGNRGFSGDIDSESMQKAMSILSENGNEITDEVKQQLIEAGIDETMIERFTQMRENGPNQSSNNEQTQQTSKKFIITSIASVGLLILLIIFIAKKSQ